MPSETIAKYSNQGLELAVKWGEMAKKAGIVPADISPIQAAIIVQTGHEIGLQPLQSLRSMSFIKGRICMTVQLQLALAKKEGVGLTKLEEKDHECYVTLERGKEKVSTKYTLTDAKKAGLVKEGGAYTKYEKQMLRWRAIGDALRLICPDLVMGLLSPEEAKSIEPVIKEPFPVEEPEDKPSGEPEQLDIPEEFFDEVEVQEEAPKKIDPAIQARRFDYLKACREIKDKVSESDYYAALNELGFKKSSDVKTIEEMTTVYRRLKELVGVQGDE